MHEPPYGKWCVYSPENTIRFNALRLHKAGATKSNPSKIIGKGTDWRFLNDLKKALKGKGEEGDGGMARPQGFGC
jgi:NitT/TauT family transport system substrate-binding protein